MQTVDGCRRGGGNQRGREEGRASHPLGDELGSLAAAAVELAIRMSSPAASRAWRRRSRTPQLWGADTVLLVPAVVDAKTSYQATPGRARSTSSASGCCRWRKDLKVVIAVEEVWNKFLLSPLEFARYVDEFESPLLRAYFDVGNVVFYGFPQDWIRTLGPRIAKVHLKDFNSIARTAASRGRTSAKGISTGRRCVGRLADVKYNGFVTTEVNGGDAAYLNDLAGRVDRFLAGEKPVEGLRRVPGDACRDGRIART